MSLRDFRQLVLIICLLWIIVPACNADDWPSIAPEDLKMTSIPQQPGAEAVILYRQEIYNDVDDVYTVYERIKILTEAGRKYADIQLPYIRGSSKFTSISARTVHPDSTSIDFQGKPLDKTILKTHGIKEHVKTFTLPDAQVGSILDVRFTWILTDGASVWVPNWHVQKALFQKKVDLIFIPSAFEGHVAWSAYLPKQYAPQIQKNNRIELHATDVPALSEEPYMPPVEALRWRANFYYVNSPNKDMFWKDNGNSWNSIVESFLNQKKTIAKVLPQIITPADTPEQKVRKIYAYITQFENRSYIPERDEKEEHARKITENKSIDDILKQHSGDHDDLNLLFASLVRGAGIPARMMLVPDRSSEVFDEGFLSFDQFDALIVIVQLNGKDVFLDPGTRFCPYGLLNWRYSAVEGLVQKSEASGKDEPQTSFAVSPPPNYQQGMIQRKATMTLADDGSASGTLVVGFFGLEAMNRRQVGALTDAAGKKKSLEDEIKGWLPASSEISLVKDPQWDATETPLIAEFKISGPFAVNAGKRRLLALHIFEANDTNTFPSPDRTQPIYFDYPYQIIDEVRFTVSKGTSVESLPENDAVRLDYALYETKQKMEQPDTIYSLRNIIMGGIVFPITKYKEIKDFYDKAGTGDRQQVLLKVDTHAEGN
jgi:transglutaminase-like putative cysteine protease